VANASSSFSSQPYINFDGNLASHWHSRWPYYSTSTGAYSPGTAGDGQSPSGTLATNELVSGHQGEWVSIELPKKIKLEKLKVIGSTRLATVYQFPKDVVVAVSETGLSGSWSALETATLISQNISNHSDTINITTQTSYYKYFALIIKSISTAGVHSAAEISELEFYGYEEGSASLDTTLKTVYNVPATTGTQLEVYYDGQDYGPSVPTSITDKTGNGNNTTTVGSGIGFDSTYKAFTFDGTTNGKIEGTHGLGTGTGIQYSMSLWFKADVLSGNHRLATFGTQGTQYQSSTLLIYQNDIHLDHWLSEIKTTSDILVPNVWYHLVAIHTGPGTEDVSQNALYLNGIKLEDVTTGGSAANGTFNLQGTGLTIGADSAGTNPFDGSIANFRLYSKALNADQVKELYDYQKDYFLGSKSQVTLYKGHLGVGVTEPSGQLELAGDERIQAYPPRGMTHTDGTATGSHTTNVTKNITYIEGHGEFKASASLRSRQDVDYDGHQPYNAFDYTDEDFLIYGPGSQEDVGYNKTTGYYEDNEYRLSASSGTPYGHWLQLEMPYKINVKSYFIQHHQNDYWPQDWQIWASNDDVNWTLIHTYTGGTYDNNPQYYTVAHTGHYKIYTMIITRIKEGSTLDRVRIQELRYFGTPGPTTLDKGSLSLTRSLDVPRVSRYDVDTETPRPEKLLVDLDTTVNGGPTDISGKGNHGTVKNGASYSPADKAFKFSAAGHYIQAELNNSETGNQYHSVSLWFNITSGQSSNWRCIFECGENPRSGTSDIALYIPGSQDTLSFSNGGGHFYSDTLTNLYHEWHHIVLTYDGANRKMYLDGELHKTQATTSWAGVANMTLRIGRTNASASGGEGIVNGLISNFKLYWQTALEPSEIKKLYRLGRTGQSMVISDTAVGIGKVPEAQLDVRGSGKFAGAMTVQGQTRLTDFVSLGSGTNSTARLFVDDPILVKTWNAFDNNSSDGEYTFEAKAITLVHFHFSGGEDPNISESYLIGCANSGSPTVTVLKGAGYLHTSTGHGDRIVRFRAQSLPPPPAPYNSTNFHLRISAIWRMS
jgi:hypothetical protein